MIIVCPSCGSKFQVDDNALTSGRKVRCSDCKDVWFQEPILDEATELDSDTQEINEVSDEISNDGDDALSNSIPSNLHPSDDDGYYNPEEDLTVLPQDDEIVVARPTEEVQKTSSVSLMGVLFIFICLFGATVAYILGSSDSVASKWKPSIVLYDMLGMDVPYVGKGLTLNNLKAKIVDNDGKKLLYIRGRVDNESDETLYIPSLRVELEGNGLILQHWVTPDENYKIDNGESIPFEYGLPSPKYMGEKISVYFVDSSDSE